jgi:hypothetical protein
MTRRRKVHPQFLALEVAVVVLAGVAACLLLPHLGAGRAAGMAADRALIIVLRHAGNPRRRRKPAGRKTARSAS